MDARLRVLNGAELLDQYWPKWYRQIDLSELNIDDPGKCILAQLFGSFSEGYEALELDELSKDHSVEHGFWPIFAQEDDVMELNYEWTSVINERRNGFA